MKRTIWIFNHYATGMYMTQSGRHYWFAENLMKNGYEPHVFCSNIRHNSKDIIEVEKGKSVTKKVNDIPFTFVKTSNYTKNGTSRIKNMLTFYKKIIFVARNYAKENGKPDVILASSVHPLTLVAGIKLAKEFGVPCICEVRDLWPESIVAYGSLKRNSFIARLLYRGEKWIYKKADSIIMTWEGGQDYIKDQKWDNQINLDKVKHINNGVVIKEFDKNSEQYKVIDYDLDNKAYKNIVYTGSIRKVNNIGLLLDAAKLIENQGEEDIRFLIYGDGDERKTLETRCETEGINNVIFKGRVEKRYIPSILKKSYANILHNSSTSLDKYGQSQNKFFEYLAAGKCIIQTYTTGYSICEKYNCGISVSVQNANNIANVIIQTSKEETNNSLMGKNAREAACDYDFAVLTEKLITIIEEV